MAEACFTDGRTVPIHTIFCIGRNYAAHARELNNSLPASPLVFIKPDTTLIHHSDTIVLPTESQDVQHEVEVVVILGKSGKYILRKRPWNM